MGCCNGVAQSLLLRWADAPMRSRGTSHAKWRMPCAGRHANESRNCRTTCIRSAVSVFGASFYSLKRVFKLTIGGRLRLRRWSRRRASGAGGGQGGEDGGQAGAGGGQGEVKGGQGGAQGGAQGARPSTMPCHGCTCSCFIPCGNSCQPASFSVVQLSHQKLAFSCNSLRSSILFLFRAAPFSLAYRKQLSFSLDCCFPSCSRFPC